MGSLGGQGYGAVRDAGRAAGAQDAKAGAATGGTAENPRAVKRARLVWTPQLHRCFVKAVNESGVDTAAPKQIMKRMQVKGLTRLNVACHLQSYRAYLKRRSTGQPDKSKIAILDDKAREGASDEEEDDEGNALPPAGGAGAGGCERKRTAYTQEAARYALGRNFKLLGLRECHLDKLQADADYAAAMDAAAFGTTSAVPSTTAIAFQPLTERDEAMLCTIVDGAWLVALPENYTILSEAKAMRRRNGKAELEVVPDLATFVASEVEYGEYDDY